MHLKTALLACQGATMLALAKPIYPGEAPDIDILAGRNPAEVLFATGVWIGADDEPLCYINPRNVRGHIATGFSRVNRYDDEREQEHFTWSGAGKVEIRKRPALGQVSKCKDGERHFGWCGPGCVCCAGGHAGWIDDKPPREPVWGKSCQEPEKDMCQDIEGDDNPPRVIGQFLGTEEDPHEITLDSFGQEAVRLLNATEKVKDNDGAAWLGDHPLRFTMTGKDGAWAPESNCFEGTMAIGTNRDGVVLCMGLR
ncbi:hypothetical protein CP532_0770 [Ophiocordyceps camponoti-leonardi (nom. inval.)]|nr:hypothetical protein CP532_0770 [Ophiocordyceps camponoti-leonardi (nom. inval.)]